MTIAFLGKVSVSGGGSRKDCPRAHYEEPVVRTRDTDTLVDLLKEFATLGITLACAELVRKLER